MSANFRPTSRTGRKNLMHKWCSAMPFVYTDSESFYALLSEFEDKVEALGASGIYDFKIDSKEVADGVQVTLIGYKKSGDNIEVSTILPSVKTDTELDINSENPVQNKVVTKAINDVRDEVVDNSIDGVSLTYTTNDWENGRPANIQLNIDLNNKEKIESKLDVNELMIDCFTGGLFPYIMFTIQTAGNNVIEFTDSSTGFDSQINYPDISVDIESNITDGSIGNITPQQLFNTLSSFGENAKVLCIIDINNLAYSISGMEPFMANVTGSWYKCWFSRRSYHDESEFVIEPIFYDIPHILFADSNYENRIILWRNFKIVVGSSYIELHISGTLLSLGNHNLISLTNNIYSGINTYQDGANTVKFSIPVSGTPSTVTITNPNISITAYNVSETVTIAPTFKNVANGFANFELTLYDSTLPSAIRPVSLLMNSNTSMVCTY